jgi:hypothetical protein
MEFADKKPEEAKEIYKALAKVAPEAAGKLKEEYIERKAGEKAKADLGKTDHY